MTRRYDAGIGQAFPGSETIDQRSCPDRLSFVVCNFHVKKTITTTLAHTQIGEKFAGGLAHNTKDRKMSGSEAQTLVVVLTWLAHCCD